MRAYIGTKFLDLRDCEDPRFKTINCQLDQIVWWMQGRVFQLALTLTGKKHRILPVWWSGRWEYPWAILAADLKIGEEALDCGCGGSPLLPYLSPGGSYGRVWTKGVITSHSRVSCCG